MSFNINNKSLSDSASFAQTIHGDFYPGGVSPVLNTSASLAPPVTGKTLASWSVSDVLSGDFLNRSTKYPLASLNKSVSSSLNNLITGGGAVAVATTPENATISVANPEATDFSVDDEGNPTETNNATLTGAAAWNRILANSIAGKNIGSTFVEHSISVIRNSMIKSSELNASADEGRNSGGSAHPGNSEMQSAGRRDVTLISELSAEEKSWFNERLTLLKSKYEPLIDDFEKIGGFAFDIPDAWANDSRPVYNGEITYFPDARVSDSERIISDEIIRLPHPGTRANAYICAALIELLILLHEKNYHIGGGLDAGRGAAGSQYVDNDAFRPGDHTYGRAIDIFSIGRLNSEIIKLGSQPGKEVFLSALEILLEALADVPQYLMPDLIVVSDHLASDLGITDGLEPTTAAVKVNRPYLQYVSFSANSGHRDHIHLSFSGMRAGKYVGPGGAMTIQSTNVSSRPSGSADTIERGVGSGSTIAAPISSSVLDKNYFGEWGFNLGLDGVYQVLTETWCSPEVAAILAAIAVRESGGGHPGSLNPNALTGDFMSMGILQINMGVGRYLKDSQGNVKQGKNDGLAHGTKTFELTDSKGKQQIQGWLMAIANWESVYPNDPKPTIDNYNKIITQKYELEKSQRGSHNAAVEAMRPLVDKRVWIPRNQAWMAFTARRNRPPKFGDVKATGYEFQVWGDGYRKYGWLFGGVKFDDAATVYQKNTGKTKEQLKKWLRNVYKTDPSVFLEVVANYSGKYIDRWIDGEVFP